MQVMLYTGSSSAAVRYLRARTTTWSSSPPQVLLTRPLGRRLGRVSAVAATVAASGSTASAATEAIASETTSAATAPSSAVSTLAVSATTLHRLEPVVGVGRGRSLFSYVNNLAQRGRQRLYVPLAWSQGDHRPRMRCSWWQVQRRRRQERQGQHRSAEAQAVPVPRPTPEKQPGRCLCPIGSPRRHSQRRRRHQHSGLSSPRQPRPSVRSSKHCLCQHRSQSGQRWQRSGRSGRSQRPRRAQSRSRSRPRLPSGRGEPSGRRLKP